MPGSTGASTGGSTGASTGWSIGGSPGKVTSGSFTNSAGTLAYELYVPWSYKQGTAVPMVVALHGCTENADVYRRLSGWDKLADTKNFIVVFPQQSSDRNRQTCWNWFQQSSMTRGSGEASMIADLTTSVAHSYSVNSHRAYVAGFSAGG